DWRGVACNGVVRLRIASKKDDFLFVLKLRPPPSPTLFPYTTLFRSQRTQAQDFGRLSDARANLRLGYATEHKREAHVPGYIHMRSEEHTSELQSRSDLVCRLLLEKKKKNVASRFEPLANSYLSRHND